jgi:hypothetical protein
MRLQKGTVEFEAWLTVLKEEQAVWEESYQQHKDDFHRLLARIDIDTMSRLLRCHLVIEYYLTHYLEVAHPTIQISPQARLSFSQKLELAGGPSSRIAIVQEGLKELNRLRNRLAHNLQSNVTLNDVASMRSIITIFNRSSDIPVPDGIELIEQFTSMCTSLIHGQIRTIETKGHGLGLAFYAKSFNERLERARADARAKGFPETLSESESL